MNNDIVQDRMAAQQKLVGREVTLEEAVDVFDGELTSNEVREALERANADGYLFFDGDTVMVF